MQTEDEYVLEQTQFLKDVLVRYSTYVNMTPSRARSTKTPTSIEDEDGEIDN